MGWSSANDIFDGVAEKLLEFNGKTTAVVPVLEELIARLQDNDWDTEDESLERFKDHPEVVEAFRLQGVSLDDDTGDDE